jgi:hypothetical protein
MVPLVELVQLELQVKMVLLAQPDPLVLQVKPVLLEPQELQELQENQVPLVLLE